MMHNIRLLCSMVLMVCTLAMAPALAEKPPALTPEQDAAVNEIAAYINKYRNMKGEFTQISPSGNIAHGIFYLSKPGKMRFEYAPPNPFLIVADGSWVTIKNQSKNKADQYPLSQTPLRLILSSNVNLRAETNIFGVETVDGQTTVTLEDRKGTLPGRLILVYDRPSARLLKWIVVDGKGRKTVVTLQSAQEVAALDPKLFRVKVRWNDPAGQESK